MKTVIDVLGNEVEGFEGDWIKLSDIDGEQVAVQGFNGPHQSKDPTMPDYFVVGIEYEDGTPAIFSTSSKPLMNRLERIQNLHDADIEAGNEGIWPILGTFSKVPSKKNPSKTYWTLG